MNCKVGEKSEPRLLIIISFPLLIAFVHVAQNNGVETVETYRVCGELSVSRSLGDPDYKGFPSRTPAYFCWPKGHSEVRRRVR